MRQIRSIVLGVVAAVLLAVCSGCGGGVREEPGGKTTIENEKGKVTLESRPGDNNSWSVETKTGEKLKVGSGANAEVRLPPWLPACPNGTVKGSYNEDKPGNQTGMVTWTTTDTPQKTYQFYEKALRDAGLTVNTMGQNGGVAGGILMASETSDKRRANVMVGVEKGETVVQASYILK
jgi:hypothetical protein